MLSLSPGKVCATHDHWDAVDEDRSYPGLEAMKEVHVLMWTRGQPPKGPSYLLMRRFEDYDVRRCASAAVFSQ